MAYGNVGNFCHKNFIGFVGWKSDICYNILPDIPSEKSIYQTVSLSFIMGICRITLVKLKLIMLFMQLSSTYKLTPMIVVIISIITFEPIVMM